MNTVEIFQTSGDEVELLKKSKGMTLGSVYVKHGGSVLVFNDDPPTINDSPQTLTEEEQQDFFEASAKWAETKDPTVFIEAACGLALRIFNNTYKRDTETVVANPPQG